MDSTLHRGSFEKHESHYNSQKRLLTGYGVTFGSLLNCPHSLACQPCHIPFAEGAIKIPVDWNPADSFLSIKRGDNEFHRSRDSMSSGSGINQEEQHWAAAHFAKQRRRRDAHGRHADLTNITTELENATLMFCLCHKTLGHKPRGWLTM